MALKYQIEIDKIPHDFNGFEEVNDRIAFRWVFEDMKDSRNFLPVYVIDEKRKKSDEKRKKIDFKGWALSFFETQNQARDRLLYYLKDKPELYKKTGTHSASGILNTTDGLSEIIGDEFGHYNHFEYENVELEPKFTLVEKIAN